MYKKFSKKYSHLFLVKADTLELIDKQETKFSRMSKAKKNLNYWIGELKISPDGTKVAFGAYRTSSTIEVVEIANRKFSTDKNISINAGLSGSLTHMDWSSDS